MVNFNKREAQGIWSIGRSGCKYACLPSFESRRSHFGLPVMCMVIGMKHKQQPGKNIPALNIASDNAKDIQSRVQTIYGKTGRGLPNCAQDYQNILWRSVAWLCSWDRCWPDEEFHSWLSKLNKCVQLDGICTPLSERKAIYSI